MLTPPATQRFRFSSEFDKDYNCIGATHILVLYDSDEPIRHEGAKPWNLKTPI